MLNGRRRHRSVRDNGRCSIRLFDRSDRRARGTSAVSHEHVISLRRGALREVPDRFHEKDRHRHRARDPHFVVRDVFLVVSEPHVRHHRRARVPLDRLEVKAIGD